MWKNSNTQLLYLQDILNIAYGSSQRHPDELKEQSVRSPAPNSRELN